jgi:hypothetical protein
MKKIFAMFAAFTLLLGSFAPLALADTSLVISGNGAGSENEVEVEVESETTVVQSNNAQIVNNITSNANTGGNDANDNTGGDVVISTGNAVSSVDVVNKANLNEAIVEDCNGCETDYRVKISGNGAGSENEVEIESENKVEIFQDNYAYFENNVDAKAKTGYNDANRNTGGDVTIVTGHAVSDVSVLNAANANVAVVGGNGDRGGYVSARIMGNGADSENEIELEFERSVVIVQDNFARFHNDVDAYAKTGHNDANDNTGGDVGIDTGNAHTFVTIDNLANFNYAAADCCEFDVRAKIAENGAESENEIEAEFENELEVFQGGGRTLGAELSVIDLLGPGNWYEVDNDVYANAKTGWNEADRNTYENGDPYVFTGHALSETEVHNSGNVNVFGSDGHLPHFHFDFDLGEIWDYLHHMN